MNFESISTFLDLVQNPAKYQAALQALKDEQERLNAVIETVGKASELDSLRKKVEKEANKTTKYLQDREDQLREKEQEADLRISKREADLQELISNVERIRVEAELHVAQAEETVKSYVQREKEIRAAEDSIKVQRVELEQRERAVDAKLSKLRSVLG